MPKILAQIDNLQNDIKDLIEMPNHSTQLNSPTNLSQKDQFPNEETEKLLVQNLSTNKKMLPQLKPNKLKSGEYRKIKDDQRELLWSNIGHLETTGKSAAVHQQNYADLTNYLLNNVKDSQTHDMFSKKNNQLLLDKTHMLNDENEYNYPEKTNECESLYHDVGQVSLSSMNFQEDIQNSCLKFYEKCQSQPEMAKTWKDVIGIYCFNFVHRCGSGQKLVCKSIPANCSTVAIGEFTKPKGLFYLQYDGTMKPMETDHDLFQGAVDIKYASNCEQALDQILNTPKNIKGLIEGWLKACEEDPVYEGLSEACKAIIVECYNDDIDDTNKLCYLIADVCNAKDPNAVFEKLISINKNNLTDQYYNLSIPALKGMENPEEILQQIVKNARHRYLYCMDWFSNQISNIVTQPAAHNFITFCQKTEDPQWSLHQLKNGICINFIAECAVQDEGNCALVHMHCSPHNKTPPSELELLQNLPAYYTVKQTDSYDQQIETACFEMYGQIILSENPESKVDDFKNGCLNINPDFGVLLGGHCYLAIEKCKLNNEATCGEIQKSCLTYVELQQKKTKQVETPLAIEDQQYAYRDFWVGSDSIYDKCTNFLQTIKNSVSHSHFLEGVGSICNGLIVNCSNTEICDDSEFERYCPPVEKVHEVVKYLTEAGDCLGIYKIMMLADVEYEEEVNARTIIAKIKTNATKFSTTCINKNSHFQKILPAKCDGFIKECVSKNKNCQEIQQTCPLGSKLQHAYIVSNQLVKCVKLYRTAITRHNTEEIQNYLHFCGVANNEVSHDSLDQFEVQTENLGDVGAALIKVQPKADCNFAMLNCIVLNMAYECDNVAPNCQPIDQFKTKVAQIKIAPYVPEVFLPKQMNDKETTCKFLYEKMIYNQSETYAEIYANLCRDSKFHTTHNDTFNSCNDAIDICRNQDRCTALASECNNQLLIGTAAESHSKVIDINYLNDQIDLKVDLKKNAAPQKEKENPCWTLYKQFMDAQKSNRANQEITLKQFEMVSNWYATCSYQQFAEQVPSLCKIKIKECAISQTTSDPCKNVYKTCLQSAVKEKQEQNTILIKIKSTSKAPSPPIKPSVSKNDFTPQVAHSFCKAYFKKIIEVNSQYDIELFQNDCNGSDFYLKEVKQDCKAELVECRDNLQCHNIEDECHEPTISDKDCRNIYHLTTSTVDDPIQGLMAGLFSIYCGEFEFVNLLPDQCNLAIKECFGQHSHAYHQAPCDIIEEMCPKKIESQNSNKQTLSPGVLKQTDAEKKKRICKALFRKYVIFMGPQNDERKQLTRSVDVCKEFRDTHKCLKEPEIAETMQKNPNCKRKLTDCKIGMQNVKDSYRACKKDLNELSDADLGKPVSLLEMCAMQLKAMTKGYVTNTDCLVLVNSRCDQDYIFGDKIKSDENEGKANKCWQEILKCAKTPKLPNKPNPKIKLYYCGHYNNIGDIFGDLHDYTHILEKHEDSLDAACRQNFITLTEVDGEDRHKVCNHFNSRCAQSYFYQHLLNSQCKAELNNCMQGDCSIFEECFIYVQHNEVLKYVLSPNETVQAKDRIRQTGSNLKIVPHNIILKVDMPSEIEPLEGTCMDVFQNIINTGTQEQCATFLQTCTYTDFFIQLSGDDETCISVITSCFSNENCDQLTSVCGHNEHVPFFTTSKASNKTITNSDLLGALKNVSFSTLPTKPAELRKYLEGHIAMKKKVEESCRILYEYLIDPLAVKLKPIQKFCLQFDTYCMEGTRYGLSLKTWEGCPAAIERCHKTGLCDDEEGLARCPSIASHKLQIDQLKVCSQYFNQILDLHENKEYGKLIDVAQAFYLKCAKDEKLIQNNFFSENFKVNYPTCWKSLMSCFIHKKCHTINRKYCPKVDIFVLPGNVKEAEIPAYAIGGIPMTDIINFNPKEASTLERGHGNRCRGLFDRIVNPKQKTHRTTTPEDVINRLRQFRQLKIVRFQQVCDDFMEWLQNGPFFDKKIGSIKQSEREACFTAIKTCTQSQNDLDFFYNDTNHQLTKIRFNELKTQGINNLRKNCSPSIIAGHCACYSKKHMDFTEELNDLFLHAELVGPKADTKFQSILKNTKIVPSSNTSLDILGNTASYDQVTNFFSKKIAKI